MYSVGISLDHVFDFNADICMSRVIEWGNIAYRELKLL